MQINEVDVLKNQLNIARNEINNLRQQVRNLQHVQRKDIETLNQVLSDFRCEGCRLRIENTNALAAAAAASAEKSNSPTQQQQNVIIKCQSTANELFRPIGIIRTVFPEKRAIPRQSSVGGRIRGLVELNANVFTNPEHALDGLQDYSHLWLIYHFHKNTSHPKAKVAPPRLAGERVGIFSTRSPHRPCPIGLSLVEIEKIDGATIGFFGTDMIDGTPVLDIKPYIPFYDAPILDTSNSGRLLNNSAGKMGDFYNSRQDPDGEESELELMGAAGPSIMSPPHTAVKVPNWVACGHRLTVLFNERSERQLTELQVERHCLIDVLEADPRSVFLRTKYGSQIFTFQLGEVTVTCRFDDRAATVTVLQIRRTENVQNTEVVNNTVKSPSTASAPSLPDV